MNTTAEALRQRSFDFAVKAVKLTRYLSDKKQAWVLARQVLRSGTSIGANLAEAHYAASRKDFLNKCKIAQKECAETFFWIQLLQRCDFLSDEQAKSLADDCDELRRMLSATCKTIENNGK